MSGGFFRGTSADQDTRFSNKQAKLMKSQKFAAELEHLVDITKVKMDVVKPWIAHRVTELLGFEDEVLINFIYGLLDGKGVNGKEVQISLTGFMEKNTGKFMKELWVLLLSAQNNASGVPQQFLDAKEEETRTKKAEADRITNEIQMKKEKERKDQEQERVKKMEGGVEMEATNAAWDPVSKSSHPMDAKEIGERNGTRGRNRRSRSRSISKSFSNSRSYSGDRDKSRSVSKSPEAGRHSIYSGRVKRSPSRRTLTPLHRRSPRRSLSPSRGRLSSFRRRSRSRSPYRSPSPIHRRYHSPYRRRSPSPFRCRTRRSPSPIRRRRSPSPMRRRSPMRHRSPSPKRRPSPSPLRRRYQRSPSTPRLKSTSPMKRRSLIHGRRRSPISSRYRSPSSDDLSSPSPIGHRSASAAHRTSPKFQRSPIQLSKESTRSPEKRSPVAHQPSSFLRSPQRDPKDSNVLRNKVPLVSPSPEKSPSLSESPQAERKRSPSEDRRLFSSPNQSPVRKTKEQKTRDGRSSPQWKSRELKPRYDSPETTKEENDISPARLAYPGAAESQRPPKDLDLKKEDREIKGHKIKVHPDTPDRKKSPTLFKDLPQAERKKSDEKIQYHSNIVKDSSKPRKSEIVSPTIERFDNNDRNSISDSESEESHKHKTKDKGNRKHKRSDRREVASDDDYSYDSESKGRKESKRRRKEEKKIRKEEKRRRREERHHRRKERHAEKLKMKNKSNGGECVAKRDSHQSDDEVSEQKRLEIELRNKALESLKAKKGISH